MRFVAALTLTTLSLATAGQGRAQTCKAPRVLVVLDKSSSMVTGTVAGKTKWEVAKSALNTVLTTYQASIDFGLMIFPSPNQCGPGAVKVPIGSNTAADIMKALSDPPPTGGNYTPMSQSLDVAGNLPALNDSSYSNNVLLITDGWQWCDPYDISTRFLPVSSVATLKSKGITTYVVGFGEAVDTLTLNKMAATAGTKVSSTCNAAGTDYQASNNCYYQANDPQQLVNALQKIAKLVSAEKCDGVDNDCNGLVDDGLTRPCTSKCGAGVETCAMGSWGACSAPQPTAEVCDGKDNNCDGTVDEGCACVDGERRPCGSGQGECKPGAQTCVNGTWGGCADEVAPSEEVCDGKDNNCDGTIDEGLTRPCQTACGSGLETCQAGSFVGCTARQPTPEICDGVDNDCDGKVDGEDALCANGLACVDGICQAATGDGGCDCRMSGPAAARLPLAFLLGLVALALFARSRRSR